MANPRRPLTSEERSARVQARTFPGSAGGFMSSTSPVRQRMVSSDKSGGSGPGNKSVLFAYDSITVP